MNKFAVLATLAIVVSFPMGPARADDLSMDVFAKCKRAMDRDMVSFRNCQYNERLKVVYRIKDKQCSPGKCFYRLTLKSRVPNSSSNPNDDFSAVKVYKGSGFMFVELGEFKAASEEAPHGSLLIDENGRSTIVGLCTGNGCLDFQYVAGTHRSAVVYGPFDSGRDRPTRILEIPR
jgi:hypothetical protein